jgi:hypothetical protein
MRRVLRRSAAAKLLTEDLLALSVRLGQSLGRRNIYPTKGF